MFVKVQKWCVVCDEDYATHNNGTNEVGEVMKQQESAKHIKVKIRVKVN